MLNRKSLVLLICFGLWTAGTWAIAGTHRGKIRPVTGAGFQRGFSSLSVSPSRSGMLASSPVVKSPLPPAPERASAEATFFPVQREHPAQPLRRHGVPLHFRHIREKEASAFSGKTPEVILYFENGNKLQGQLTSVTSDSLELLTRTGGSLLRPQRRPIAKVNKIVLVHRGNAKNVFRFIFAATLSGAVIGFASGSDEPGFFSLTAEQKAVVLGMLAGSSVAIIYGSYQILKSIDTHVPLAGLSLPEKRKILQKIRSGTYRSTPWVSLNGGWQILKAPMGDIRSSVMAFRYYFRPRAALEYLRFNTGWSPTLENHIVGPASQTDSWTKSRYSYGGLSALVYPFTTWRLKPYISWGIGILKEEQFLKVSSRFYVEDEDKWYSESFETAYDEKALVFPLRIGLELQVYRFVNLHGSIEKTFAETRFATKRFEAGLSFQF